MAVDEYAFVLNLNIFNTEQKYGYARQRRYSLDTVGFMKHGKLTVLSIFNLKFKFSIFHCIGVFEFEFDQNMAVLIKI